MEWGFKYSRDDFTEFQIAKHMSSDEPLVSIIIPCYNYGHFLGEAIESALGQTHSNVEIIVVDDGSSDATPRVAGRYKDVIYIDQENLGVSIARNNGLSRSSGDFIVFLDADDRLLPSAVAIGLNSLKNHPESAFGFGRCRFISEIGSEIPTPLLPNEVNNQYLGLLFAPYIWTTGLVLFRRSTFDTVRGFDPAYKTAQDYELYLRIARNFPIYYHENTIAEYRQHGKNNSRDPILMINSITRILNKEWAHIRGNKEYEKAWEGGLGLCREYYGNILVSEIRTQILEDHDLISAMKGLICLVKHYPKGIAKLVLS
jgi:glycosyltransferase involved in cell wall biosynthesis